jgi:phospholipid/cholesterol/gamma-HCH transport system substrate-binding protein
MTARRTNILVGVFVVAGIVMAVGAILWLGSAAYFKKGKLYVSYFDRSVEQIAPGSPVKYLGLDVGLVKDIDVAPNKRLVEVVMQLGRTDVITNSTVAEIKTTGLTGVGFVELQQRRPGAPVPEPHFAFSPPYPVIPTKPSELTGLIDQAREVVSSLGSVDFEGISTELKRSARAAEDLFSSPRLQRTIANLDSMTRRLDDTAGRLEKMMASRELQNIPAETAQTLASARELLARTKEEIDAMKLAETTGSVKEMVSDTDQRTRVLMVEIERLIGEMRQATESLQSLLERLNNNPSELIFGNPAPPRQGRRQ